eukprot:Em0002g691a
MPSRNQKKRSKQRAEYLQKREDILSQENKAKARARYKADPEKKKASVRDTYKADPEKKKASVRDTYKADPEKKKASVRDTYNANAVSKRAAKRQRYQEGVEENRAAKRQRYQEGVEENRAAKRRIYRGNSATIKAARRSRYWKGRRTTTTTQRTAHFSLEKNSKMAEEVGKEFFDDSEGEEVEEAHTSSFITTSAPASASLTTSSSAAPPALALPPAAALPPPTLAPPPAAVLPPPTPAPPPAAALPPPALAPPHGGDVVTRHNRLRDIFVEFCRQAHLSVRVEAGFGLSRVQRNTRPADVLVQDWVRGSPAAIDITVTSPLTPAMLAHQQGQQPMQQNAESMKPTTRRAMQELGWTCILLAVETYGHWGKEAQAVFSRLASFIAIHRDSPKSSVLNEIYSRLNMSKVRSVARSILVRGSAA